MLRRVEQQHRHISNQNIYTFFKEEETQLTATRLLFFGIYHDIKAVTAARNEIFVHSCLLTYDEKVL